MCVCCVCCVCARVCECACVCMCLYVCVCAFVCTYKRKSVKELYRDAHEPEETLKETFNFDNDNENRKKSRILKIKNQNFFKNKMNENGKIFLLML